MTKKQIEDLYHEELQIVVFKTLLGILTFPKYWYNTGLISDKDAYSQQKGEK